MNLPSKAGIGYQLSNGDIGILHNNGEKLLLKSKHDKLFYFDHHDILMYSAQYSQLVAKSNGKGQLDFKRASSYNFNRRGRLYGSLIYFIG